MSSTIDLATRALAQFDALVELDENGRKERLAELRETDPALADELARMLRADARSSGVIDRGLPEMAATIAEPGGTAKTAGVEGQRVGPFVLKRLLGRGGMGEVWLAQRTEGDFRQDVALKLLKRLVVKRNDWRHIYSVPRPGVREQRALGRFALSLRRYGTPTRHPEKPAAGCPVPATFLPAAVPVGLPCCRPSC